MIDTKANPGRAILLLGHKPDSYGKIQEGAKARVTCAAELYRRYPEGQAPVIIPSGWYWPKDIRLRRFREAEILNKYLLETFGSDIRTVLEPYSTSVPENLLFTHVMFPNLREVIIVTGRYFEERTFYLARMTFGDEVQLSIETCEDGLSNPGNERRLLENLQCMLKGVAPGKLQHLMSKSDSGGNLRSRWPELNEKHKRECKEHGSPV